MRIAVLTALREERLAVRRAWGLAASGSLQGLPMDSGERAISLCSGVGAERMVRAARLARDIFRPDLWVLVGFSAGLRSDLPVGEVICDDRSDARLLADLRSFPIPLRFGSVATCGFLDTAADKEALAKEHPEALAADLESEAFMQACGETPFLVLRAISDDVHTDLPLPFESFLDQRGFPDDLKIARALLRRPKLVPGLWRLAKDATAAQRALSKVLADIRPLLVRRLRELHPS